MIRQATAHHSPEPLRKMELRLQTVSPSQPFNFVLFWMLIPDMMWQIMTGCAVTNIETEVDDFGSTKVKAVVTEKGRIETNNVLVCGGKIFSQVESDRCHTVERNFYAWKIFAFEDAVKYL